MSDLAKDFLISDVGLAKRCRAVDVPIPYRGYWARKAAGQTPPKTPLPKYRTKAPRQEIRSGPEPEVRFTMSTERLERESSPSPPLPVDELIFNARLATVNFAPATTIADTGATVRRTARHKKHPQRASLQFARGERSGPIVNMEVTAPVLDRALLLADRLIRTAAALGLPLQDPPPPAPKPPESRRRYWEPPPPTSKPAPVMARLLVDGVAVEFRIEERLRRIDLDGPPRLKRRNQYDQSPPSHRMEATGVLRVVCLAPHFYFDSERQTWYDQGRSRVEDKIPAILWKFQQLATRTLREKAEAAERERQREIEERLKHELSVRRANNAKLIEALERQAGAWFRAKLLQRYLRALRRTVGENAVDGKLGDDKVDFLTWAEQYADQLNPLSTTPSNPDQQRERSFYGASGEAMLKQLLLRVSGCDNEMAWKRPAAEDVQSSDKDC